MESVLPGKPPRAAVRRRKSPSYPKTNADQAPKSRMTLSAITSNTGCASI
jgi:hypothetical protein